MRLKTLLCVLFASGALTGQAHAEPPASLLTAQVHSQTASAIQLTCSGTGVSASFTFTITGAAVGPYAGTFSETGRARTEFVPATGSSLTFFESTFQIVSPAGAVLVTGRRSYSGPPDNERGGGGCFGGPAWGSLAAAVPYRAELPGGWIDEGVSGSLLSAPPVGANYGLGFLASVVTPPRDTLAPAVNVPPNIVVDSTSPSGAVVTFAASATDVGDPAPAFACTPPSGSTFPVGTTRVTCTATDASGNSTSAGFDVTVNPPPDSVPPVLLLPAPLKVEATGPEGARVDFSVTATDAVDPAPSVECIPAAGAVFPLGRTDVSCTARDAGGNEATGSFAVVVADTTPPVLTLPASGMRNVFGPEVTSGVAGLVVTWTATATDLVDGDVVVRCKPASGSEFRLGRTQVLCGAIDSARNEASSSFVVELPSLVRALDQLIANVGSRITDPFLRHILAAALQEVRKALVKVEAGALQFLRHAKRLIAVAITIARNPLVDGLFPGLVQSLQRQSDFTDTELRRAAFGEISSIDDVLQLHGGGNPLLRAAFQGVRLAIATVGADAALGLLAPLDDAVRKAQRAGLLSREAARQIRSRIGDLDDYLRALQVHA